MSRRLVLLLALVALPAPGVALAAEPDIYTQHVCQLPDRTAAPADGFMSYVSAGSGGTATDSCLAGGHLVATIPKTLASAGQAGFNYHPPFGTEIVGVTYSRITRAVGMEGAGAEYEYLWLGDRCDVESECYGFRGQDFSWPNPKGKPAPAPSLDFQVRCPGTCASVGTDPAVEISRGEIYLRDSTPPQVSIRADGLGDTSRVHRGVESLTFDATDRGGGVYRAALRVDGVTMAEQIVDPNGEKCQKPFRWKVPCPLEVAGGLRLDTRNISNGAHQLELLVWDVTDKEPTIPPARSITVDNPPVPSDGGGGGGGGGGGSTTTTPAPPTTTYLQPVVINNNTSTSGSSVASQLAPVDGTAGTTRAVQLGSAATLRARLIDRDERPLAEQKVDVLATVRRPGEKARKVGTVTSDRTGTFSFRFRPKANMDVTFVYADKTTLKTTLYVRAAVSLRRSAKNLSNGDKLTLRARVRSPGFDPRATRVAFQVQIGRGWRTFRTAKPSKKGVARIVHHFRYTEIPVTYRFRAVTTRATKFPFLPGSSDVTSVRVRP